MRNNVAHAFGLPNNFMDSHRVYQQSIPADPAVINGITRDSRPYLMAVARVLPLPNNLDAEEFERRILSVSHLRIEHIAWGLKVVS